MTTAIVEKVYDIQEFLSIIDDSERIHYELHHELRLFMSTIDRITAVLRLYGLNCNKIIIFEKAESVKWSDEEVKELMKELNLNNYNRALEEWLRRKFQQFKEEAEKLGATPGSYYDIRHLLVEFLEKLEKG